MNDKLDRRFLRTLLPYFLLAVAVILAYRFITELGYFTGVLKRIWGIVRPFSYGFLLAYILNIPRGGIEKLIGKIRPKFIKKRKKALSIIIIYLLFACAVVLVLYLVIPYIVESVTYFISNFPAYYESFLGFIRYVNEFDLFDLNIDPENFAVMFQEMLNDLSGFASITSSINALIGVSSAIFAGFLAFISSIYFLFEQDKIVEYLKRLLKAFTSEGVGGAVLKYSSRLNSNFKRYVRTQTIDGCILGSIATIELLLMRSPYAFVLGLMLGIINYIPYFGSIIGTVITVVIVAFTQGWTMALIASAVLLITQQIDGNVIQPKLMGGSFSMSPLLVIIGITIGGAFAGVLGMIAAIPIIAVLKDMLESVVLFYEKSKTDRLNASVKNENGIP